MKVFKFLLLGFLISFSAQLAQAQYEAGSCSFDIKTIQECKEGVTIIEYCFRNGIYCPSEGDFWVAQGQFGASGEFIDQNGNPLGSVIEGPLYGLNNCIRVRWTIASGSPNATGGISFDSGLGSEGNPKCCQEAERSDRLGSCTDCKFTVEVIQLNGQSVACVKTDCPKEYCVTILVIFSTGQTSVYQLNASKKEKVVNCIGTFGGGIIVGAQFISASEGKCSSSDSSADSDNASHYQIIPHSSGEQNKAIANASDIIAYPNPVVGDEFNVVIPDRYPVEQGINVKILNIMGSIVKEITAYNHLVSISTNDLPSGLYMVNIKGGDGLASTVMINNIPK